MKKILAKTMALAMTGALLCSSITVSAATGTTEETTSGASGSTTGSSTVEGYVNPNVFTVVLPTDDANSPTFDFKLDPQKLLHATQSSVYTDADATVLFDTKTNTSNELKVQNKGNVIVDATITAEVTGGLDDGTGSSTYNIPLTADDTFAGDTSTSLYLGLKVGDDSAVAIDDTTKKAEASCRLDGVAEENFEITGTTGSYAKVLKSGVTDADFPSTTFSLTGACNSNADWTDATGATPTVSVTWTLTEVTDFAPSIISTYTYLKGSSVSIPIDLGKGTLAATKIKSVSGCTTRDGSYSAVSGLSATTAAIKLDNVWSGAKIGDKRYLKVVLDDTANTTAIIEVTMATESAPSAVSTYNYTKGSTVSIPVDLGAGSLAATKITSVSGCTSLDGTYGSVTGLSADDTSITLNNVWSGASVGDKRYLKVVFDDAASTTAIIEVTIQ